VQCLDNTTCSGATPFCDTAAVPIQRANRCQQCLPPALTDAGLEGCDGGAGSMMCAPLPPVLTGQFVCR
jgi:hypothetical protein